MKKVKALLCMFGLAGLLIGGTACGGDPMKDMEKIVDEMCACKDEACLKDVEKKFDELGKKYAGKSEKDFSEEDQKKMMALAMKAAECQQKITSGGAGAGGGEEEKPAADTQ